MDQTKGEVGQVRIFVGGLSSQVSPVDLKERFTPLGTVLNVTTSAAKYGSGPHRGFAYVDFLPTSEATLRKLFSAYNGCKWRGGLLRIEVAKEHYIDKLQKEWAADAEALAAKEAERILKTNDVSAMPVPKQAKSWPLLLLEQPENPDRWTKKRDFEHGAEGSGMKIFFPRLKKVKTVPFRGSGKHKRSFQRVESLPLRQLSTCDCDESLRTGSCDCSTSPFVGGDARDHLVTNAEHDPMSLGIAHERQRQLDLLTKFFSSESPRNSKLARDVTTSSIRDGVEIKTALPRDIEDGSERRACTMENSSSHHTNGDDSGTFPVSVNKENSWRAASEVVSKKVNEPEKVSTTPENQEECPLVQADEPEMWLSFMDTMALPAKTEENVSEFDLDELSLMLSDQEEESQEEEEAEEAIPDAPKKKAKRKKKKGKKSKQILQTQVRNEQDSVSILADDSDIRPNPSEAPLTFSADEVEVSRSESEELLTSSREEISRALVEADESTEHEGISLSLYREMENLCSAEPKGLVNGRGNESSGDDTCSLDGSGGDDIQPLLDDRDDFFAEVSSSDESLDSVADEGDLWVSGINEVARVPIFVDRVDASSQVLNSKLKVISESMSPLMEDDEDEEDSGQDLAKATTSKFSASVPSSVDLGSDEEEEPSVSAASDDSIESEGYEPDVWVSGLDPGEDEETSEELDSDSREEQPGLWVSGLESTSTVPQNPKAASRSDAGKLSPTPGEADEEPQIGAALGSTSHKSASEISVDKANILKPKEENSTKPGTEEEVAKISQAAEASAPKRNELTRATWRSLVGETGRVVFSLQQVLDGRCSQVTPATNETATTEGTRLEESAGVIDPEKGIDDMNSSPSMRQPDEKEQEATVTHKLHLKPTKAVWEGDAPPPIPVFTDSSICPFMKSPNAEEEWLSTKSELRTDYRSKHKQAVRKSRKLRGR